MQKQVESEISADYRETLEEAFGREQEVGLRLLGEAITEYQEKSVRKMIFKKKTNKRHCHGTCSPHSTGPLCG